MHAGEELAEKELKESLEGLAKHLFGDVECRWAVITTVSLTDREILNVWV